MSVTSSRLCQPSKKLSLSPADHPLRRCSMLASRLAVMLPRSEDTNPLAGPGVGSAARKAQRARSAPSARNGLCSCLGTWDRPSDRPTSCPASPRLTFFICPMRVATNLSPPSITSSPFGRAARSDAARAEIRTPLSRAEASVSRITAKSTYDAFGLATESIAALPAPASVEAAPVRKGSVRRVLHETAETPAGPTVVHGSGPIH